MILFPALDAFADARDIELLDFREGGGFFLVGQFAAEDFGMGGQSPQKGHNFADADEDDLGAFILGQGIVNEEIHPFPVFAKSERSDFLGGIIRINRLLSDEKRTVGTRGGIELEEGDIVPVIGEIVGHGGWMNL